MNTYVFRWKEECPKYVCMTLYTDGSASITK